MLIRATKQQVYYDHRVREDLQYVIFENGVRMMKGFEMTLYNAYKAIRRSRHIFQDSS